MTQARVICGRMPAADACLRLQGRGRRSRKRREKRHRCLLANESALPVIRLSKRIRDGRDIRGMIMVNAAGRQAERRGRSRERERTAHALENHCGGNVTVGSNPTPSADQVRLGLPPYMGAAKVSPKGAMG